jgi:hypothetical protein
MDDILTHAERLSLERGRQCALRGRPLDCLDAAILVNAIDALVRRTERDARRRRKPATPPTIKTGGRT